MQSPAHTKAEKKREKKGSAHKQTHHGGANEAQSINEDTTRFPCHSLAVGRWPPLHSLCSRSTFQTHLPLTSPTYISLSPPRPHTLSHGHRPTPRALRDAPVRGGDREGRGRVPRRRHPGLPPLVLRRAPPPRLRPPSKTNPCPSSLSVPKRSSGGCLVVIIVSGCARARGSGRGGRLG